VDVCRPAGPAGEKDLPTILALSWYGKRPNELENASEYRVNILGERERMPRAARKPESKVRVIDPAAVGGKEVLLIDDIPAGPSLFQDCEHALLQAGATKVVCPALARPELSGAGGCVESGRQRKTAREDRSRDREGPEHRGVLVDTGALSVA
jgi:hypothetical protein